MAVNLFGWRLTRADDVNDTSRDIGPVVDQEPTVTKAVTAPLLDDGAVVMNTGGYFGYFVDLDGTSKDDVELVTRYRDMSVQPEVEDAIDDIVHDAIIYDDKGNCIKLVDDKLEIDPRLKEIIQEEFKNVLRILDFSNTGQDVFRRWYIDGKLYYQAIIDTANPQLGIKKLVYIDPRKIKKVRQVLKTLDPATGVEVVSGYEDFYIFSEKTKGNPTFTTGVKMNTDTAIKIAEDAIINVNSGLMDASNKTVLSYLHKAIKPLNQLRMIEDAIVIYRLSRAPERRVFYIDVGGMPKLKGEQYLKEMMTKFKNKLVYDNTTGEIRDDRKYLSMMEDFWIPRQNGSEATKIETLPAGQNLGQLEDVQYFEKKLYKALKVPYSRMEGQTGFVIGRSSEITRDEIKFSKFIERLRNKFSYLFDELLKRQLVLKGVCTAEEFDQEIKEFIHYDYLKDNNYNELKELDILNSKLDAAMKCDQFVGKYVDTQWMQKNIWNFTDEEIEKINNGIMLDLQNNAQKQAVAVATQEKFGLLPDPNAPPSV